MDSDGLLQLAKNGDKDAFGNLYKIYYERIYRYCSIHISDSSLALDICQETFIRAWKSLPSFSVRSDGTFQAYLFRIAHNLVIDQWRKKKEYPLEIAETIHTDESLEDKVDAKDRVEEVRTALSKLNDIDRQIIILRYFEELSHNEISKILHINDGAIRVRTIRILKKLQTIINHL